MDMATQASLFTPTLSAAKPAVDRIAAPWKQSLAQFSTPKPIKPPPPPTAQFMRWQGTRHRQQKSRKLQLDSAHLNSIPTPHYPSSAAASAAQVEEFYVITWDSTLTNSPKGQVFEMLTGRATIVRQGPNLLKLAREEQRLALGGTRLYQFYRVFPNGEVQFLHPKDGVYSEKVNPGRAGVGQNMRSIGKNVSPIEVKFTGKQVYDL